MAIIILLIPLLAMVAVAHDPRPAAIVGAIDPRVPMVIPVIIANHPGVSLMIFPVVIAVLTSEGKGGTG